MKTNVATTSIEAYNSEIRGRKENSQDKIVFEAMKKIGIGCTMRQLQEKTGLEINVLSRSLNNLRIKHKKIDYFDADAVYKGKTKRVHHYFVRQEGKQLKAF